MSTQNQHANLYKGFIHNFQKQEMPLGGEWVNKLWKEWTTDTHISRGASQQYYT